VPAPLSLLLTRHERGIDRNEDGPVFGHAISLAVVHR
jgi:hypothetical protein